MANRTVATNPGGTGPTAYAVPTMSEARAIQAVSKGEATPVQQKLAMNWIVRGTCRAGRELFVPGDKGTTDYLCGRLSVSLQIGWVLGQPAENFRTEGDAE
jgi:hypothetical protein